MHVSQLDVSTSTAYQARNPTHIHYFFTVAATIITKNYFANFKGTRLASVPFASYSLIGSSKPCKLC